MKYGPIISDAYYHIFNQGNNAENIFIEEKNYAFFLKLMDKYLIEVCDIYAYCLLKNHFHFFLKTKEKVANKTISQKLSHLFNAYSQAINKSYGRTGSLFRDRFKRKKINCETYLKQLGVYTHLNPQNHKMISDFRNYKHSSYLSYLSKEPSKLDRDFILKLFDGISNFEYAHLNRKAHIEIDIT